MMRPGKWTYVSAAAVFMIAATVLSAAGKKPENYKELSETLEEMHLSIDTNYVKNYNKINDYSLLGIQYGVALSTPSFQPVRNSKMVFVPVNVGVMYTYFCKMFGYMPYFGVQAGLFYTMDAYEFATSESGYTDSIFDAYKATLQVLEVPALAYFHYDFWKMRIMANFGIFGGYRMSIHREYKDGAKDRSLENSFAPVENRWDYGIKGGAGFAFIFDPIEIHITASYKYSWSNLYQPNYLSKYYYKWAYPTNIVISVGVHYQLTRRAGTPTGELKRQAKEEAEMMMAALREQKRLDSLSRSPAIDTTAGTGIDTVGVDSTGVSAGRPDATGTGIDNSAVGTADVNMPDDKKATATAEATATATGKVTAEATATATGKVTAEATATATAKVEEKKIIMKSGK